MLLYSDYWFRDEKGFFIYFPWNKYKLIFKTDSLFQFIMKLILFPIFLGILLIDLTRIISWNLFIRPIYLYRLTRGTVRDWVMDLDIDKPLNLPIITILYPILGVLWIIEAHLHIIIILPIHLGSLIFNMVELFFYQLYTIYQQNQGLIERRPIILTASSSSQTHKGFSRHVVGGKTYTTSYDQSKVKNLSRYIPIVGIESMN